LNLNGFILPGHVSTIIGAKAYSEIDIPCSISGFEPTDILESILDRGNIDIVANYDDAIAIMWLFPLNNFDLSLYLGNTHS